MLKGAKHKNMKSGKAAEVDGIAVDFLKMGERSWGSAGGDYLISV